MSSSIFHLICEKEVAAVSFLRRGYSKLCVGGGGDSALRRVSSPWLMLPPSFEKGGGGGMSYNFYSLAQNKLVSLGKKSKQQSELPNDDALFVGSSHGWLALHNRRDDRSLFLSNPITGENIKLPPIHTGDDVERVILTRDPRDQHCRAVATLNGARLAFCSPRRSSHWTTRITGSLPYGDFTYSTADGLVFCVRNTSSEKDEVELEAWDVTDPSSARIYWMGKLDDIYNYPFASVAAARHRREGRLKKLHLVYVEEAHKLFLVRRHIYENDVCPYKTVGFDVYLIDRQRRALSCVDSSLDGLVMFVGPNHSLAVEGSQFPELKPDSVYFTDSVAVSWPDDMCSGHDIGIFDYKKKTVSSCYYPCDHGSLKSIQPPPFWFTPSPIN